MGNQLNGAEVLRLHDLCHLVKVSRGKGVGGDARFPEERGERPQAVRILTGAPQQPHRVLHHLLRLKHINDGLPGYIIPHGG